MQEPLADQLLATKFFVPSSPHVLVSRPRLSTLLDGGLQRPLMVVSAPAGFGAVQLACACRCSGPARVDLCHKPARPAASATTTLHLRHAFAGIPLVEGLVNLRELPPRSRFFAPFYRFAGIDSAPARAFALIEPSSL